MIIRVGRLKIFKILECDNTKVVAVALKKISNTEFTFQLLPVVHPDDYDIDRYGIILLPICSSGTIHVDSVNKYYDMQRYINELKITYDKEFSFKIRDRINIISVLKYSTIMIADAYHSSCTIYDNIYKKIYTILNLRYQDEFEHNMIGTIYTIDVEHTMFFKCSTDVDIIPIDIK